MCNMKLIVQHGFFACVYWNWMLLMDEWLILYAGWSRGATWNSLFNMAFLHVYTWIEYLWWNALFYMSFWSICHQRHLFARSLSVLEMLIEGMQRMSSFVSLLIDWFNIWSIVLLIWLFLHMLIILFGCWSVSYQFFFIFRTEAKELFEYQGWAKIAQITLCKKDSGAWDISTDSISLRVAYN